MPVPPPCLPQPVLTYRRRRWTSPLARATRRNHTLLLGSNEHRTGHQHPLLHPKKRQKAKGTLPSPGAWQIYDWMGATDGCAHATRSDSPDLRRGCACTRNLTEIAYAHSPRNKSCVCPTHLACRAELSPAPPTPVLLHATTPDGILDAGCFTMFWCPLPATCPCARARPPDRLWPPVRSDAGETQSA